jgi:multidrug resistance efflux pump
MVTEKEQGKNGEVDNTGGENTANESAAPEQEVESLQGVILGLERSLAEKDSEIANLTQALEEAHQAIEELNQAMVKAVAAYKEMLIRANPGMLPEMITGDSIDEVDESVKKARAVMERVRQEMEAEASKTRVPAGAPPRSAPDLSGLTAREKIQYAMRGTAP